jgi:NAD(P)-dependent dehydrogenase (short-subunit alcohol dehydrogenase family)
MCIHNTERFENKTAIVTGSTRGIGAAIAKRLAAEGASVVVSGLHTEEGSTLAKTIREDFDGDATFVTSDICDPDAVSALVDATVDRYGQLDILVNNAAIETETSAGELTMEEWERGIDTEFRG